MQIPGERALWWTWGEGGGVFGVKEGVTLCEECNPVLQNRTETEHLIFALLEGLHRCEALRCWQVRRGSSGQLSLCECVPGLSKISLGSLTRTGYQLPCLLGGGHSLTCINTLWECVSFITTDQIILVTRHPRKSRSIPPGAVQAWSCSCDVSLCLF